MHSRDRRSIIAPGSCAHKGDYGEIREKKTFRRLYTRSCGTSHKSYKNLSIMRRIHLIYTDIMPLLYIMVYQNEL